MNPITESTETSDISQRIGPLRDQLNRTLVGKEDVVELILTCLIARGHLLFDDLPGLGKTTIAKALAQSLGGRFSRVQCTPDLLPTDITGFNIFDQKNHSFEFQEGPVFTDLLLADEINRATPRTQSALFEAMAERQVTVDNQTLPLPPSFMVIATQNPVESHGAYPLPEAQLDRFAMKLNIGYPQRQDEIVMLGNSVGFVDDSDPLETVLDLNELRTIQTSVANVEVCEAVRAYLVDLGSATRNHPDVELGLSPRGLLLWLRVAQAWAALAGRGFVIPDDIQAVATPVLGLRIKGSQSAAGVLISEIIESVSVPNESR
ncbi:MAG: MoxR family ATPase [Planctomycetota bacterium]|nr:MoxR family ATPase [Planctomycetota bacterium]